MSPKDHQHALIDAIKLRAGLVKNSLSLHPLAADLVDQNTPLLPALAEVIGTLAAKPGSSVSIFGLGVNSNDFGAALAGVMKSATVGKLTAHAKHRALCDPRELNNFRDYVFPSMDVDIGLEEVGENGEIGNMIDITVSDGLTAKVRQFGRNVYISRRLIVNDDIGFAVSLFANAGAAAARLEAGLVYGLIESNPTLSDSQLMFHVDFGNIEASALDSTSLSAAMGKLRTMETPAGQMADLDAASLVVAPALELTALTLVKQAGADIDVIASPWLAAGRWYLVAAPEQSPVIALLHLKGSSGGVAVGKIRPKKNGEGVALGIRFDTGVVAVGRTGIVKGGV